MNCLFLDVLPVEIRLAIYAFVLPYRLRLKLRQHVPGLLDLSLLRVNSQVHDEGLSVLYDSNVIVVTRNDFCHNISDARLKTPIQLDHVRHLHMTVFNRSISCAIADESQRCNVCQPHAIGLVRAFIAMPRLRTAEIRDSRMQALVTALRDYLNPRGHVGIEVKSSKTGHNSYYLDGSEVAGKQISFLDTGYEGHIRETRRRMLM